MSARTAYMICRPVFDRRVGLGDVQITHANDDAGEAHGVEGARALIGAYLSQFQDERSREAGRCQHLIRCHHKPIQQKYATLMRTRDGELIGHLRERIDLEGLHGESSYMVRIERVRELDEVAMPDIAAYGLTEADYLATCGRYTYAQLLTFHRKGTLERHCGKKVTTIVRQCATLAKSFFGGTRDDGLALALNRSLTNWVLDEASAALQLAATCPFCGWHWWRKTFPGHTQRCPMCKKRVELAAALGSGHFEEPDSSIGTASGTVGQRKGR